MASNTSDQVVVGVSGGIAAYKGLELVRLLTERGHRVTAMPTLSALRFVGEASFAALSGNPVATDIWSDVQNVPHIQIARDAAAIIVAPATADLLARAAGGHADDLLTATILSATCPVLLAPAMHSEMWANPATVENVNTLRRRGLVVLEPAIGRLTGADAGKGRLPDPVSLADALEVALWTSRGFSLAGKRVLVTAGGTREAIDPVRFIGNRSSGRQGYAFASAAAALGASVQIVAANVQLPVPAGCDVQNVSSADELQAATLQAAVDADYVVMTAAVADYRPSQVAAAKLKKTEGGLSQIPLTENADVLAALVAARKNGQKIIGFAAETEPDPESAVDIARTKLLRKGCDAIVLNQVGQERGFEAETNQGWLITADQVTVLPLSSKLKLATTVWHLVK